MQVQNLQSNTSYSLQNLISNLNSDSKELLKAQNSQNYKFHFDNSISISSYDSSNGVWNALKWLKNHVDLVQMSVLVFLIGNIISVPISHGTRLWNYKKTQELNKPNLNEEKSKNWSAKFFDFYNQGKQSNQVDVFIGLRNDIAWLILGFLTYTLPVLAFDNLGQSISKNQVVKAIENGELLIKSKEEFNNICSYLGGLIGLIFGLITNDLLKSGVKPIMEQFIGKQLLKNKTNLSKLGFDSHSLLQEISLLENKQKQEMQIQLNKKEKTAFSSVNNSLGKTKALSNV